MFEHRKQQVKQMPKKYLRKNLKSRGLSSKGAQDVLQNRLIVAIQSDQDEHRVAWEEEQAQLVVELAEKEAALAHLTKVNAKYAKLKAPALRKQLAKRGLKTSGKKAKLLERLATALEEHYEEKQAQAKRIAAEEANIEETAAEQATADEEYTLLLQKIKKMNTAQVVTELQGRQLDAMGDADELKFRLIEHVTTEKGVADEGRQVSE